MEAFTGPQEASLAKTKSFVRGGIGGGRGRLLDEKKKLNIRGQEMGKNNARRGRGRDFYIVFWELGRSCRTSSVFWLKQSTNKLLHKKGCKAQNY